jgi:hypothetical protein
MPRVAVSVRACAAPRTSWRGRDSRVCEPRRGVRNRFGASCSGLPREAKPDSAPSISAPRCGRRPARAASAARSKQFERVVPTQSCPALALRQHLVVDEALVARGVQHLHRHRVGLRHQLGRLTGCIFSRSQMGACGAPRGRSRSASRPALQHPPACAPGRQPQDAHGAAVQFAPICVVGCRCAGDRLADAAAVQQQQAASRYSALERTLAVLAWTTRTRVPAGFEVGVVGALVQAAPRPSAWARSRGTRA